MLRFGKLNCLILLLLKIDPYLGSVICLLALALVLLHYNLLWALFHILLLSIIG
jgi:hypothetical protein